MAFVKFPGLPGKVYVPERIKEKAQKHLCRDCFSCEFCSDDRCQVCRKGGNEECTRGCGCAIEQDDIQNK